MPHRAAAAIALSLLAASAPGADLAIREWQVPWELTRPRDPYVHAADEVWFVGQTGDYVARLDPADGAFDRYPLEAGAGPHNLIVDDDGIVWYAGNRAAHIGRLDPGDGSISKVPMPDAAARDPHTLVFDAAGDIWFTVQHGNFIGRLDPQSSEVDLIRVPTPDARPYGIVVAGDGRVWATEFGSNKLAVVDPRTLKLREIELPRAKARPRRLQATSDGTIWYVDYAGGMLGSYDPDSGEFIEWPAPGGETARPYGMAVDAQDRIWFVETGVQPNRMTVFDTSARAFIAHQPIPSGAGAVRHMMYFEPAAQVWFGTDANTIGSAELSAGPD